MAKPQKNSSDASNLALSSVQNANVDTGSVMSNAGNYQAAAAEGARQTLTQGQGYAAPAASTYEDFAKTGGFSPTDETTFLNRATRGVAGTYQALQDQAARQRAAAGGLGTGGETVALARHAGQDVATANTDAEAALKQQENQNKLSGAGGLSNLYGQTNQLYNTQTGQVTAQGAQLLQALGIRYSTQEEAAKILAQLASRGPAGANSNLTSILQQVQPIAGIASGVLGAIP